MQTEIEKWLHEHNMYRYVVAMQKEQHNEPFFYKHLNSLYRYVLNEYAQATDCNWPTSLSTKLNSYHKKFLYKNDYWIDDDYILEGKTMRFWKIQVTIDTINKLIQLEKNNEQA